MAKQKFLKLTGLILASHLVLSACQTTEPSKQPKASTVQNSSSSHKAKTKTRTTAKPDKKKQVKDHEKTDAKNSSDKVIPGVTVPTSDGFILTEQSKILSHTKDGIVVDHNGHSHFIFYADLQGTAFAHLIPSGAVVTAAPKQTSIASGEQSPTGEHHYEFNPADIVAEDALGYTVRHGDHYHYILKSSLTNQQQAAATTHVQSAPLVSPSGGIAEQSTSSEQAGVAGIDYPTSDGFLFDGTGIRGWTAAGLLVDHDGHLHLLLTSDIAQSKWAHLIPNQPGTPPLAIADAQVAPAQPAPSMVTVYDETAEKRTYLAQATGLNEDQIVLLNTPEGPAFMYPHEDHTHVVLLSKLDVTKPFDDGHHDQPNRPTPISPTRPSRPTVPETPSQPLIPTQPSQPSPVHDEVAEKRAYLAQATGLNEEQITLLNTPEGPAFMYPHGNHSHIVLLSNLDVTQPFDDGHGHEAHEEGEESRDHADIPTELPEAIAKQREELAAQLNLPVDRIRVVTVGGQITGFEYPHEDHNDFVALADVAKVTKPLTDDDKRELTAYIRKAYGLLLGTPVHFHDHFVVFAIPHPHQDYDARRDYTSDVLDPNYDAGHVHPYSVPLHLLKIPTVTGNPELDFDNELQAAAERLGIPASEVKIKDGKYFVLPGKDHDHYLNILTPREGYEAYLANKLPAIKAGFASGDFSKAAVIAEVERVREAAASKYGPESADYRRIFRALEEFGVGLDLATTSTEAYKDALLSFENRYIKGNAQTDEVPNQESNPLTARYTALTEQLAGFSPRTLRAYGVHPDQMIAALKGFVEQKDVAGLDRIAAHLNAIARVEAAPSELAPRVAYMDYLIRSIDNPQLPAALRQQAISRVMALHQTPRTFKSELGELAALKEQIKLALSEDGDHSRADEPVGGNAPLFHRQDVVSYVNQMREFLVRRQEVTATELAEGFSEELPLFVPERPTPQPSRPAENSTSQPVPSTTSSPADDSNPSEPVASSPATGAAVDQPAPTPQPTEDETEDEEGDLFDDFTEEELEDLLDGLNKLRDQNRPLFPVDTEPTSESSATDTTTSSPEQAEPITPVADATSQPSSETPSEEDTEDEEGDLFDDFTEEELEDLLDGLNKLRDQNRPSFPVETDGSAIVDTPTPLPTQPHSVSAGETTTSEEFSHLTDDHQPATEAHSEDEGLAVPTSIAPSSPVDQLQPPTATDAPTLTDHANDNMSSEEEEDEAAIEDDQEDTDEMDDILAALDALKKAREEMNWFN